MARAAITGHQVRDLMTFHAVTVAPDDTVKDASDLLVANNVAALPVVDEANRCVGVISATDLLGFAQERGEDFESFYAAEGLSRELLIEHLERADFSDIVVKQAARATCFFTLALGASVIGAGEHEVPAVNRTRLSMSPHPKATRLSQTGLGSPVAGATGLLLAKSNGLLTQRR